MSNMVELTLELPKNITKDEAQTLLAVKLYETERISLGQAENRQVIQNALLSKF